MKSRIARQIACLNDYSKIYEGFLKKWILEDFSERESFSQFGGTKGIGVEHMIVCMVDRILKLLETLEGKAAVLSSQYNWSNAFECQDPTITIQKFIRMNIWSSLIPILIDFMCGRSMQIKFNGEQAGPFNLVGGSPAGSRSTLDKQGTKPAQEETARLRQRIGQLERIMNDLEAYSRAVFQVMAAELHSARSGKTC